MKWYEVALPTWRLFGRRGFAMGRAASLAASAGALSASASVAIGAGEGPIIVHVGPAAVDASARKLDLALVAADPIRKQQWQVIQLDGALTEERAKRLAEAGVHLGEAMPANAYLAKLDSANPALVAGLEFVRWRSEFQSDWKLDPMMGKRALATQWRQGLAREGKLAVTITLFRGEATGDTAGWLGAQDGVELHCTGACGGNETITAVVPGELVDAIAGRGDVQYVEEFPELSLRNDTERWIVQSNILNVTPLHDAGLMGEGQVIGIIDGRIDPNHCSFNDPVNTIASGNHRKFVAYNTAIGFHDAHGTHVAGIAAGDSGAFNNLRGMAYLSRIAYDQVPTFLSEMDYLSKLNQHHSQGARVHTNSWGADLRTDYNGWTRAVDAFMWDHEDDLVLTATTNFTTLFTPENAKNGLAIGATQDSPNQGIHGSGGSGPTIDGRMKPELHAPGVAITSSAANTACNQTGFTGTSMAAPAVAGVAALTREYYMRGFYPTGAANPSDEFTPSGALLRATLINSGVDMTGVAGYPSDLEGWGRVLADEALYFSGQARSLVAHDVRRADPHALLTGWNNEHFIDVTGATEKLKVTMAFNDAPACIGASFAPINDVDLEVTSPSGVVFLGNNFDLGVSSAGGLKDAINSVEQVHVVNPEVGLWVVRVVGAVVNAVDMEEPPNIVRQGYAVVVSGEVAEGQDPCPTDLNGDGVVNAFDLAAFLGAWGPGVFGDFSGDGQANGLDLPILLGSWGACP